MQTHTYALPPWVGLAFLIVVCGSAAWKGGREEQIAAGGVLLSTLATIVLRDPRWLGPQWGAFGADLANLALLVALSLRTRRYWPLVAASFQLLCVLTHVARMVDAGVHGWAYATAQIIFTQWLLVAIGVGVWNTWRGRVQTEASGMAALAPGATRR